MDGNIEKFIAAADVSLAEKTFIKLILSNYKGPDGSLQKISVRLIETKKGSRLMFQSRFETRDVVKNFEFDEGLGELRRQLGSGFRNGHLFTTTADLQLDIGKRSSRLAAGKATIMSRPNAAHDRQKRSLIDPNAFYLKALGVADDSGRIKSGQHDKWRQINKFIEILSGLVDASPLRDKKHIRIVDMGSGKGYLTFAAYDHFTNVRGIDVAMTGVEARPELVETCSQIAQAGGLTGLKFVEGRIADFDPGTADILIALHACDTATDDALFKGVSAYAAIIVAAPCCHKELRKQITPPEILAGILKHGVMLERTAETITDGLRSLLLEREGYSTKLFEFVPTEHTPKNNMLVGTRAAKPPDAGRIEHQITEVKSLYGIRTQHLEDLLKSSSSVDEPAGSNRVG